MPASQDCQDNHSLENQPTHRERIMALAAASTRGFADDVELVLWADVLDPLPFHEIAAAAVTYQRTGPVNRDTNKLIPPAAGDIYQIAQRSISEKRIKQMQIEGAKATKPEPPNPPEKPLSDAEREQLAIDLKRFGITDVRFPKTPKRDRSQTHPHEFAEGEKNDLTQPSSKS